MITKLIATGIVLHVDALPDADSLFATLMAELTLTQHQMPTRDRGLVDLPRLTAWYGDSKADYLYSGIMNRAQPMTPTLDALRTRINARLGTSVNSVLCNYYRSGRDGIGWHADDERGLSDRIVSVSLGAERLFELIAQSDTEQQTRIRLPHGSILTMTVASQAVFKHRIAKVAHSKPRLNLTFRTVTN